ncbi:MAG: hypothetical protein UAT33_00330 [Buchnera aphidicola (Floraphis choui)]
MHQHIPNTAWKKWYPEEIVKDNNDNQENNINLGNGKYNIKKKIRL